MRVMHRVHEVKLTEIAIMTPYKAQRDYLKVLADKEGLLGPDGLAAVVTITESQGYFDYAFLLALYSTKLCIFSLQGMSME